MNSYGAKVQCILGGITVFARVVYKIRTLNGTHKIHTLNSHFIWGQGSMHCGGITMFSRVSTTHKTCILNHQFMFNAFSRVSLWSLPFHGPSVARKWKWLHNLCLLRVTNVGRNGHIIHAISGTLKWGENGSGYITPTFSGSAKVARNGCITPASSLVLPWGENQLPT